MLIEETLPTLQPVPGMDPEAYVEQSLERLRNTAIRHRNHQIATDGSQKIVQRLLYPIRERLARGETVTLLATAVAAWMVYLIRASERFGRAWTADDPCAPHIASIAERIGNDPAALAAAIVSIRAIFDAELAESAEFRAALVAGLEGLLSDDPIAYVRSVIADAPGARLKRPAQRA
jgi:fructuronate reductase